MDENRYEQLMQDLELLKVKVGEKTSKQMNLELFKRMIVRLESFSNDCEQCQKYLMELTIHFEELKNKHVPLEKSYLKDLYLKKNELISHLQKQHKLITEGYYLSVYMSLGMSLGVVYGLLLSENLAMGLSLGLSLGVAIGAGLDANAKKKGLTI